MIAYIIKFILCSGFLYSFYKVFLERESMYTINRIYLLFSLIFALVAPLYKMELPITATEAPISPELIAYLLANPELLQENSGLTWTQALDWIYSIIGVGLSIRFIINIVLLILRIKQEEKYTLDELTFVLDDRSQQPFSFLNYIFLPKDNYQEIHPNLIQHEKAHCIQKHSWDILFMEIYQIIFWFNPFVYLYKKSIQLNHEFLADEYVLQNNVDLKFYQHQILDSIVAQSQSQMASHFNFILTKKRLLMMTKNTSKRKVRILSFASFPFLLAAFVLFSQKSFAQEVEQNAKKVEKVLEQRIELNSIQDLGIKTDGTKADTIKKIKKFTYTIKGNDTIKKVEETIIQNNEKINSTEKNVTLDLKGKEIKYFVVDGNRIDFTSKEILNKIDPKDIKSLTVNKANNSVIINKKDNDSIRLKVYTQYFEDGDTPLRSIASLKTNRLLTENVKDQLLQLKIDQFKNFEIFEKDGLTKIKIDGKDISFPTGIFDGKELTEEQKKHLRETELQMLDKISKLKINKEELNITTGKPYTVSSFFIPSGEKSKEQIQKELDHLKKMEKETKKQIKALEKQQKQLK